MCSVVAGEETYGVQLECYVRRESGTVEVEEVTCVVPAVQSNGDDGYLHGYVGPLGRYPSQGV